MSRIIYYYQTLTDLEPLRQNCRATDVLLSAFHFGTDDKSTPYLHLNDYDPSDPRYDKLWATLASLPVKVGIMLGGAGGAFEQLFSDFDTYYGLLSSFLSQRSDLIQGINLDVEERTKLTNFEKLVVRLHTDFPTLEIHIAPVLSELLNPSVPGAFSGFAYNDLFKRCGDFLAFVNVQMYGDSFTCENYMALIHLIAAEKLCIHPSKLVVGMEAGDSTQLDAALDELEKMAQWFAHVAGSLSFGGAFVWEYFNAYVSSKRDPSEWAARVALILN